MGDPIAPILPITPITPIGTILGAGPFELDKLPTPVQQVFATGKTAWLDALKIATAAGIRDREKLADIVFFMQHPERMKGNVGRLIDPKDEDFYKTRAEWILYWTIVARMLDAKYVPSVFLAEKKATKYEDFIAAQTTGRITLMVNGRDSDGTGTIDATSKTWTGGFKDDVSTFDAMQLAVESLGKGDTLYIANWQFIPQAVPLTITRSGVADWGQLLVNQAKAGVNVRVMIAQHPFYMDMFMTNLDALDAVIKGVPDASRDNFKYIVTAPSVNSVHHQKFVVAKKGDTLVAFCGGLDISQNRTPGLAASPRWLPTFVWHDGGAKLEGKIALDLEREFVERWNRDRASSKRRLPGWNDPEKLTRTTSGNATGATNGQKLQMVRTFAVGSAAADVRRDDVWRAYFRLIARATKFLYLENQYFFQPELGDAIAKQAQAQPDLIVMVVVGTGTDDPHSRPAPSAPYDQRVGFAYHQNQMWFRHAFFERVLQGGVPKDRVRVYTLNYRDGITHTKLVIADDEALTIGSANANPRGFFFDTELNVILEDPKAVKDFRQRLWSHDLHVPVADVATWKVGDFFARWDAVAKKNQDVVDKNKTNVGMPAMLVGEGVVPFQPLVTSDPHYEDGARVRLPLPVGGSIMLPEVFF